MLCFQGSLRMYTPTLVYTAETWNQEVEAYVILTGTVPCLEQIFHLTLCALGTVTVKQLLAVIFSLGQVCILPHEAKVLLELFCL